MAKTFVSLTNSLALIMNSYTSEHNTEKLTLLETISKLKWKNTNELLLYHEQLLFLAAYADNRHVLKKVQEEFERISSHIKQNATLRNLLQDSGLPYTTMVTRFTHDLLNWMQQHKICNLSIDSFDESGTELNTLLKMTLPALEHDHTTAGLENADLLHELQVPQKKQITFLLNEFSKLNNTPIAKDFLWESLKAFVKIESKEIVFWRAYNKLSSASYYFHNDIQKKFDSVALINAPLPPAQPLNQIKKEELEKVIKQSLVLTMRETDPSTYMNNDTLKYFNLERGISVALYGMQPGRQLALQSYIGYTLFKNGYPVAYGGSWVFGRMAMFGLNVFEAFRGGESGYVMCQLLRVYKQVFQLDYFEVEAYQFGLDNPDGIKSGAFWFYYRFGFIPINKDLRMLAEKEALKIKTKPGYRTNERTLLRFTDSNIALHLKGKVPAKVTAWTGPVTAMIAKQFDGDRAKAITTCVALFKEKISLKSNLNPDEIRVLEEVALIAHCHKIKDIKKLEMLLKMVHLKPLDPYTYNLVLSELIG
jgi:hypothetical protein